MKALQPKLSRRIWQLLPVLALVTFLGWRGSQMLRPLTLDLFAPSKTQFMAYACEEPDGSAWNEYSAVHNEPVALEHGIVSITVDDGWESAFTVAQPLFNEYGFRASYYIISEYSINHEAGYMSMEQIHKLADEGNEIGSHSIRHCDMTSLTEEQLSYDARTSRQVLVDRGLGIKSFVHPYGLYNSVTTAELSQSYSFIRSSDPGFNGRNFNPHNILSQSVEHDTGLDTFKKWLETAQHDGRWLVLTYHRFDEAGDYNATTSQLREQLKAIRESGLEVLPLSAAAEKISSRD